MRLVVAFLRLIRWPNLLFIVLTQGLFYYAVILTSYERQPTVKIFLTIPLFPWLCCASVFIAAAGYIINDYFDLNIDQVNKPHNIIIQKLIKRRWAIVWHIVLSTLGIFISLYISWKIGNWWIAPCNFLCVLLLWFYSTRFKKTYLIGNVIISLLTAWVVFVLYMSELDVVLLQQVVEYREVMKRIFKLAAIYGGFAFIISLVREVVKDMEDLPGDEKFGCRTMPIVSGVPASRIFAIVWLIVLLLSVMVILIYGIMISWFVAVLYGLLFILIPGIIILQKIYKAVLIKDFHTISSYIKLLMLMGIVSLLFFKWPF